LGTPGFTLEELPDLLTSMVQGAVAEPQVLPALHKLAGSGSSQAYLLFACARPQASSAMHDTMNVVVSRF
jgi:hypothetical protein